eukprot:1875849-Pleurochrysis_carterae.AAC.1
MARAAAADQRLLARGTPGCDRECQDVRPSRTAFRMQMKMQLRCEHECPRSHPRRRVHPRASAESQLLAINMWEYVS